MSSRRQSMTSTASHKMIMFPPQKNQPKLRFSLGPAEWQKLTLTAQVLLAEVHEVYVSTQIITFKRLLQFRILKKKSHPRSRSRSPTGTRTSPLYACIEKPRIIQGTFRKRRHSPGITVLKKKIKNAWTRPKNRLKDARNHSDYAINSRACSSI